MTESQWTAKLLKALRAHPAMKNCWIQKFNDRTSSGIPDFVVARGRVSIYYEVKLWPSKPTKLQAWTLKKLGDGGALITVKGREHFVTPIAPYIGAMDFDQLVQEIVQRSMF